jgi:uncharacterized protein (DUF952 family)
VPIYHIATTSDWADRSPDAYLPAGFGQEGFVHCSEADQVIGTANALFAGRQDLLLLTIDEQRLASPVIREDSYGSGTEFPHIYGPVDLDAVTAVTDFPPTATGTFDWWKPDH